MDSSVSKLASVRGPGCRRWIFSKAASACALGGAPRLLVPGLPLPSRGLICLCPPGACGSPSLLGPAESCVVLVPFCRRVA
eukprot:5672093-Pyramimonas_sp.AAC.1